MAMQSLTLGKARVQFCINGDEKRVISFNPQDVRLYERIGRFYNDTKAKQEDFERRAIAAAAIEGDKDEYDAPLSFDLQIALMQEIADWVCGQMDDVFGAGTAKKVFQDTFTFEDFAAFIEYVMSFFSQESQERVNKRLKKQPGKIMM